VEDCASGLTDASGFWLALICFHFTAVWFAGQLCEASKNGRAYREAIRSDLATAVPSVGAQAAIPDKM
jgi:hypothetical protein